MKRMLTIGLRATVAAVVLNCAGAMAASAADETPRQVFHGTLVDATCMERPACPVTEVTRAYALQLADGRLLDLGEAGTTFVGAALNGCKDTRPLINRIVYTIWPKATVKGHLHGSKIMVDSVSID
jgi:hypothetical protein